MKKIAITNKTAKLFFPAYCFIKLALPSSYQTARGGLLFIVDNLLYKGG